MKKILYILGIALLGYSCTNDGTNESAMDSNSMDGQGGSLAIFAIYGDYLYTVDENDLTVFNISTAADPVQVNSVPIGFNIETLFGFGDYLYIGSQNGMFIYSIENPEFPEYLSDVQHFTSCDPVVANETHAFVTLWSDLGCGTSVNQLEIYDISDVLNPSLISVRELVFPKGLGFYGNYLFVCDDEIKVFDISDPENSVLVHNINRLAFDVIIRENLLIAVGSEGIYQYQLDPNNIENTVELSAIEL
ncbi:LVIVD repeat-containing protein [Ulvibacter litoralis]|uniref:LVIVD repeat-containing protein n=1 Tax=Ulvibacter litoralis TaxID=227084 RepID=A0A1G7F163_9FLAO|nr:hypothetical protein [Ulvibacter litoralis]GHC53172.1 hypothetical protein GCM10008083_16430 [Ulvibacter litoralis]SDE69476.1 LVIVD repeat-containing protein [Ulvibacter litoralis]